MSVVFGPPRDADPARIVDAAVEAVRLAAGGATTAEDVRRCIYPGGDAGPRGPRDAAALLMASLPEMSRRLGVIPSRTMERACIELLAHSLERVPIPWLEPDGLSTREHAGTVARTGEESFAVRYDDGQSQTVAFDVSAGSRDSNTTAAVSAALVIQRWLRSQ